MSATKDRELGVQIGVLRGEVVKHGSSWAALQLALVTLPTDLPGLLREACVYELRGEARTKAFDACVDAYVVFEDGRQRNMRLTATT